MDEPVDLIGFSFKVEAYEKFYRRHVADIPRINFSYNEEIGRKYIKSTDSWIVEDKMVSIKKLISIQPGKVSRIRTPWRGEPGEVSCY